jgi:hypothetical protein
MSSIYLQERGFEVTAVDEDATIVEAAQKYALMFSPNLSVKQANAFDLKDHYEKYDLCFSVGVVEHFDRKTTIQLLKEQGRCAPCVIAVVPTKYTDYAAQITDERIYGIRALMRIFRDAGFQRITPFGYGDIPSKFHELIKYALPYGVYRFLQNRCSYTMGIGCVGRMTV